MLQKSTALLYPFPVNTSGAIYEGVPQAVIMKFSVLTTLANPKSDIFIIASVSGVEYKIFSGFF